MMGLQYGCPIDVWAAAVSIFELYTGKIMFQGNSNNMMLKLIQEVKGKIPNKLIRKGVFAELHFDPDYDFLYKERDRVTGREIQRIIKFEQRPMLGKDLRSLLTPAKLPESEARKVMQLADLLDKALMLDPSKRITPSQALKHPFCDVSSK
jgi:serine/threonine-protein kinase PRP4